jgi:hypothetical protein
MTPLTTTPTDVDATLKTLLSDPRTASAMAVIQRRAIALLDHKTDALCVALGQVEPTAPIAQLGVAINVRQLASTSRQAGEVVQSRRKFARDILVATLINHDNDEWDMTDAASWRADRDDLLIALMKLPPLS